MTKTSAFSKKRALFLGFVVFGVAIIGCFLFFKPYPPIEERFVVEKAPSPLVSPSLTSKISLKPAGEKALLKQTNVVHQTFNNCGPATLSMILSYYGISKSQKELGDEMRPYQHPQGNNDDKTIFPEEFVAWAEKLGLRAIHRPNGSLELIKLLLTNEIPVVVKALLKSNEDIAHFWIIRGYDDKAQMLIEDDSYFGANKRIPYYRFIESWQPYNYGYILVYQPEKEEIVSAILGDQVELKVAYQKAIGRANKEANLDPKSVYPIFNLSTAYFYLGEYQKSIEEFEKVELRLPKRMFWYQIEPILAYQKLKKYDRVFAMIVWLFEHGNRAFSELYQIKGEIYLEKGDKELARREFELALKYNKNFESAQKSLRDL